MSITETKRARLAKKERCSLIDILLDKAVELQGKWVKAKGRAMRDRNDLSVHTRFTRSEMVRIFERTYSDKHGYIYLIWYGLGAIYKIGTSKYPGSRLGQFSGALSPFEMRIDHLIETDDMSFVEEALHRYFIDKHLRGEWFILNHEDVELIKSVNGLFIYGGVNDIH